MNFFPLSHYEYGEAYFGSREGKRFRIAPDPFVNIHAEDLPADAPKAIEHLVFSVWDEPLSYAKTPKEDIVTEMFPFSDDGFDAGVSWLKTQIPGLAEVV